MQTTTKTIKGTPGTAVFNANLRSYAADNLKGYRQLKFNEDLKGKQAAHVVRIKGRYFRGEWSGRTSQVVTTFYR
jgi:hypothetical protein